MSTTRARSWEVGGRAVPAPDAAGLAVEPLPPSVVDLADTVAAAARGMGARQVSTHWLTARVEAGLLVVLDGDSDALDVAWAAVQRLSPTVPVEICSRQGLDPSRRAALGPAEPEYPFTTAQNWGIALWCLAGATLVALFSESTSRTGQALVATGWAMEAALLVVVLTSAARRGYAVPGVPRRGSSERFRPLALLGFVVVVGASWAIVFRSL